MRIHERPIIKYIAAIFFGITASLYSVADNIENSAMMYMWPIHIVVLVLFFIMLFGLRKDIELITGIIQKNIHIGGWRRKVVAFAVSNVVTLIFLLMIMAPFIYLVQSEKFDVYLGFGNEEISYPFISGWLLFLLMLVIYFFGVRPLVEYSARKYR